MTIQRAFSFRYQNFYQKIVRRSFSAQPALSFTQASEDAFANAKPFKEMPGLSKFEIFKRFLPGGKFHNTSILEIQTKLRKEFGDFYRMDGLGGQTSSVTIFNAEDFQFIHRNEGKFPFRRGLQTMKYYREKIRSDVYEVGGLIIEQGEVWYKMRTAINPILMQPRTVKYYIPLIDGIVNDFLRSIPTIQDENGEVPANFSQYLNRWTLESITAIVLEKRLGLMDFNYNEGVGGEIAKAIRKILVLGAEFEMKPSIWRFYQTKEFKELIQAYDTLTEASRVIIDEAIQKYDNSTTINEEQRDKGIFYKLMKKDNRFALVMAFDLIFGGVDTTSSALVGILYSLAKNPEKQEKLRQEIIKIIPEQNSPLDGEKMSTMPYLRGVIKESLRLYPPATMNMRRSTENFVFRGYQIPEGVDFFLGLYHVFKDPKYFGSPAEFVPERWIRAGDAASCPHSLKSTHPFAFLPFGHGVRFCAGKRFAEMEIEVFVSRLLRNYKVEWNHEDLKFKPSLVLIPDGDLKFKFTKV